MRHQLRAFIGLSMVLVVVLTTVPVLAEGPTETAVPPGPTAAVVEASPTPDLFTDVPRVTPPDKKFWVAYIVKTMDNPYYRRMEEGAKQAAAEFADYIDLTWTAAARQGDVEGQIRLVEDTIRQKVDLIILDPMGSVELAPSVKAAKDAGIPVIGTDTRVEGADSFVGFEVKPASVIVANFVVEYLGGKGKVAILEGFRGHSTAEERLLGFNEVWPTAPGIEIVASLPADWERSKGMTVSEDLLTAHPDLDFILASNDDEALGAVEAIIGAGRVGKVHVSGFDANCDALQEILQRDIMVATMDNHPDLDGYQAVVAAYRALALKETLPEMIPVRGSMRRGDDPTFSDFVEKLCGTKQ